MEKNEIQANVMLFLMLKAIEVIGEVDEELQEEVEGLEGSIQWNIGESKAYQVFEDGKYKFEMNAEIDNPRVKLVMSADTYKKLFSGELEATSAYMAGEITIEGDLSLIMAVTGLTEILMDYMEAVSDR